MKLQTTNAALKSTTARSITLFLAEFAINYVKIIRLKIITKFASHQSTIVKTKITTVHATSVHQVSRWLKMMPWFVFLKLSIVKTT